MNVDIRENRGTCPHFSQICMYITLSQVIEVLYLLLGATQWCIYHWAHWVHAQGPELASNNTMKSY